MGTWDVMPHWARLHIECSDACIPHAPHIQENFDSPTPSSLTLTAYSFDTCSLPSLPPSSPFAHPFQLTVASLKADLAASLRQTVTSIPVFDSVHLRPTSGNCYGRTPYGCGPSAIVPQSLIGAGSIERLELDVALGCASEEVTSRHITSHHDMLCHVLSRAMLRHAVLCRAVPYPSMPCRTVLLRRLDTVQAPTAPRAP